MARNVAVSIENNFVNGLISEATALNFPESAAIDCSNVIFNEKGNVTRRRGFDFESGFSNKAIDKTNAVINSYLWQNAAGSGDNNFVVTQVGGTLYFYQVSLTGALSPGAMASSVALTPFIPSGAPAPATTECQFASGYGYLFVTHANLNPFYVAYDPNSKIFTATAISIKIRDTEGFDDGFAVDYRPGLSEITQKHLYNLKNQSWGQSYINSYAGNVSRYPSNADVWWLFKSADEQFEQNLFLRINRGNSPAPKGTFILDAFALDRSGISGNSVGPVVTSGFQRPSACAFFAGRVFYSGVAYQGFNNNIYFSQIIDSPQKFGKCHQVNDPGSEYQFDLLASDGGVIRILDAGTIIKLVSISGSLLVFANNGVWAIGGSTGTGFSATDYTVRRLSSIPSLNPGSFVDVQGFPAWWNNDGIYTVSGADSLGQVQIASVTDKKIKTWYNSNVPAESRKWAKGTYNSLTKVVTWLYRSNAPTTVAQRYEFDAALSFNTLTGAFYPFSIPSSSPVKVNGIVAVQGQGSTTSNAITVTDNNGNVVTDSLLVPVTSSITNTQSLAAVTKFLCSYTSASVNVFTFAETSGNYLDWITYDSIGVDYTSYLISGFKVHGDAQKKFQSNYVYVFAGNIPNPQFFIQGIWDYANTGSGTGGFTSRQKLVYTNTSLTNAWKRVKIRGSGLSLQIKYSSVTGQPFDILGWTIFETGNAGP